MKRQRNWEDLNRDCLVEVLKRVGLESLLFNVPFVCKSWYRASLSPECWKILRFPDELDTPTMPWEWWSSIRLEERFMDVYRLEKFSFTGFSKLLVSRSRRSGITVSLTHDCTFDASEFVANECPTLQPLSIPYDLLIYYGERISELVSNWKDLQHLHLATAGYDSNKILIQLDLNCKNLIGLSVGGIFGYEDASDIATLLPNIKYLWLRGTSQTLKSLKITMEGCKELVLLDARNCIGFDPEDDEILKMGSHINTFLVECSRLEEEYEDEYDD